VKVVYLELPALVKEARIQGITYVNTIHKEAAERPESITATPSK
jgi:hypothetical protein